jgi:hypothetical protein
LYEDVVFTVRRTAARIFTQHLGCTCEARFPDSEGREGPLRTTHLVLWGWNLSEPEKDSSFTSGGFEGDGLVIDSCRAPTYHVQVRRCWMRQGELRRGVVEVLND